MGSVCSSGTAVTNTSHSPTPNHHGDHKPKASVDPTVHHNPAPPGPPPMSPYKPSKSRTIAPMPKIAEVRPPTPHVERSRATSDTKTVVADVAADAVETPSLPRTESTIALLIDPKLPAHLDRFDAKMRNLLVGYMKSDLTPEIRTIHVHTLACPLDADVEIAHLMNEVYPKLRHHYSRQGYDIQFLDVFWGWPHGCSADHQTERVCLELNRVCAHAQTDSECLYVILLNEKLGSARLPAIIFQDDFENLLVNMTEEAEAQLAKEHYILDENYIPPSYVRNTVAIGRLPVEQRTEEALFAVESRLLGLARKHFSPKQTNFYFAPTLSKLVRTIFKPGVTPENIVCFRRKFVNRPYDLSGALCARHWDIIDGVLDPVAEKELADLESHLQDHLLREQLIESSLPWTGLPLRHNNEDYIRYINVFVKKYTIHIKSMINEAIERIDNRNCSLPPKRMTSLLYGELLHHSRLCCQFNSEITRQDDTLRKIQLYLSCEAGQPMIVTGPPGCGKSTLLAAVSEHVHSLPRWENGASVVRFCNTSAECLSLDQVLNSVIQQLSHIHGGRSSIKTAYAFGRVLTELLEAIKCPLLIILDGLDQLEKHHLIIWEWLPNQLPDNVWFIVSITDTNVDKMKRYHPSIDNYLVVPPLETDDALAIVTASLESRGRTVSERQHRQITEFLNTNEITPLSAKLLANIGSCSERQTTWTLPSGTKDLVECYFKTLASRHGPFVKKVMYGLSRTVSGLTDLEVINLISCNQESADDGSTARCEATKCIAQIYWFSLKDDINDFVRFPLTRGVRTCKFRNAVMAEGAVTLFENPSYEVDLRSCFTHASLEHNVFEFVVPIKHSRYETHSSERCHLELTSLHFSDKSWPVFPDELAVKVTVFKYLLTKMKATSVFHVMRELQALLVIDTEWNMAMLYNLLFEAISALCLDENLLAQQLILRAVHQEINELGLLQETLNESHKWLMANKFPVSKREQYTTTLCAPALSSTNRTITCISNLKSDNDHMVTLSRPIGELRLYNIRTGECIRTINGILEPRDVKAIDNEDVAILCDRTIWVFNLDDGTFVSAMKGMINLQNPNFAVYSQTQIVALSRNRMCVNIMDVNSGEVVSTFKAGEDRFLNSLSVSEDGHKCVCGDEVDKPFPLLVWDLEKCQLVRDIRLPQYEFDTRMISITADGRHIACVAKLVDEASINCVMIFDLDTGELVKKLSAVVNTTGVVVSSQIMSVIQALEDGRLLVWCLITGRCKFDLRGHIVGVDRMMMSADETKCLTYDSTASDPCLRLWDLRKGCSLGSFVPDATMVTCRLSLDGSTFVVSLDGLGTPVLLSTRWSKVSSGLPYGNPDKQGAVYDMSEK